MKKENKNETPYVKEHLIDWAQTHSKRMCRTLCFHANLPRLNVEYMATMAVVTAMY